MALNYPAHASDVNFVVPEKPYIFLKPGFHPVVGPNDKVFRPPLSQYFTLEGELAVVIGRRCRAVPRQRAYEVVAGYTVVNDMSARDLGKTNINQFDWFMVFKIPEIIEFVSSFITLDPGDIIATGTPGGSKGALKAGDEVEVEISKIGKLRSVIAEREG